MAPKSNTPTNTTTPRQRAARAAGVRSHAVNLRLAKAELELLQALAERQRRTPSDMLRIALADAAIAAGLVSP